MITKFEISERAGEAEFGMICQRLVPWAGAADEPPVGMMACFLPAGGDSTADCHDQDEVMFVLSGRGSVDVGEERADVATGEVVVIPRNRQHVVHNSGDAMLTWLALYWPLHEPANGQTA